MYKRQVGDRCAFALQLDHGAHALGQVGIDRDAAGRGFAAVSYTHLRAHETVLDLVCRLLLEKKKIKQYNKQTTKHGTKRHNRRQHC